MGGVQFRMSGFYICFVLLLAFSRLSTQEDGLMVINVDDDVTTIEDYDSDSSDEENLSEPFEATHDWQTIKPGQAIPAGLHVEMNLETGLKRAKLLKVSDKRPALPSKVENEIRSKKFDAEMFKDLKEQLRQLPNDDTSKHHQKEFHNSAPGLFKTMDELKLEFEKMNITFSSENELILKLLRTYNQEGISDLERANKLIDLEYYVHQYDNAKDFITMGGLAVTTAALNSSVEELRKNAAFLIGSAMQSNPPVQISCLEGGILNHLLHILTVDDSLLVKTKALYALSCMLRQFPYAQKKFLDSGGLNTLSTYFRSRNPDMLNLKMKIITLVHDFVLESLVDSTVPANNERRRQYDSVNIKTALVEQGFCEHIPSLLMVPDHVSREKVLNSMLLLVDTCSKQFRQFATQLALLQKEYGSFARNVDGDDRHDAAGNDLEADTDYLKELNVLVNTVITKLPLYHEEL